MTPGVRESAKLLNGEFRRFLARRPFSEYLNVDARRVDVTRLALAGSRKMCGGETGQRKATWQDCYLDSAPPGLSSQGPKLALVVSAVVADCAAPAELRCAVIAKRALKGFDEEAIEA
jgi:hypothetical protein